MPDADPEARRAVLLTALGFTLLEGAELPALTALRSWLGTWSGLGAIVDGMIRQDYDLELRRYDERGWRATFYTTGLAHSPTGDIGTAFEPTPWRAVQVAAWETLGVSARRE